MSETSSRRGNSYRNSVVCNCGKKLSVNSKDSGIRLTCPSCGHAVVVPPVPTVFVPSPTKAAQAPDTVPANQRFTGVLPMMGLWSLPVIAAIAGGIYIHFDGKWRQQARIDAASSEARETVKEKEPAVSLKLDPANGGDIVEAIPENEVSQTADVDASHEHEAVEKLQDERTGDALFDAAKAKFDAINVDRAHSKVDATEFVEPAAMLARYLADPNGTKKAEAEELLALYDLASTDVAAMNTLLAMNDDQFARFASSGWLEDFAFMRRDRGLKFTFLRSATLRRNLETARQRREELRIEEAQRQEEHAKIAEATRQESERLKLAANEASMLPGVWRHKAGDGAPGEITLHSNGKINNPEGPDHWTITGRTLVLQWANRRAPGGFWTDTCIVSEDRKTYRGSNQNKMLIAGSKVDPVLAAAASERAEAAKTRPKDELIRERLIGIWFWGTGLSQRIRFDLDGTYLESRTRWRQEGKNSRFGRWEPMPRGQWSVEEDGTIRLSGTLPDELIVVTMDLDEDKLSIGYRYPKKQPDDNLDVVASRFNDTTEIDQYVALQIEILKSGRMPAAARNQPAPMVKTGAKLQAKALGKGPGALRREAADNLKALGEAANAAVFALADVAATDRDALLRQKALEALGEVGRNAGIRVLVPTLLYSPDPVMAQVAEDSLMKLLPATGGRLGIEDSIRLLEARKSGNERLAPVIESAWAASGLSEWSIIQELNRRAEQKGREDAYWAACDAERRRREADPAWQQWRQARREHDEAALSVVRSYNQYEEGQPQIPVREPRRLTAAEMNRNDERELYKKTGGRLGSP